MSGLHNYSMVKERMKILESEQSRPIWIVHSITFLSTGSYAYTSESNWYYKNSVLETFAILPPTKFTETLYHTHAL